MFCIVIKDVIERFGGSKTVIYCWIYLQLFISILYLFEIILTLYVFGLKNTFKLRIYLLFECLFQCLIYGFWINLLIAGKGSAESLLRTLEIVIILRSFRMIKILEEIHQFKIIIKTIRLFTGSFYSLILVTFVVFLFFSIIGDHLFGGIKKIDPSVTRNEQIPNNYIHMNFNDNVNSFITLFTIMAGNNWIVVEEIYINTRNKHLTKFFLLSFYFCSIIVILNVSLSLIIQFYGKIHNEDPKVSLDQTMISEISALNPYSRSMMMSPKKSKDFINSSDFSGMMEDLNIKRSLLGSPRKTNMRKSMLGTLSDQDEDDYEFEFKSPLRKNTHLRYKERQPLLTSDEINLSR